MHVAPRKLKRFFGNLPTYLPTFFGRAPSRFNPRVDGVSEYRTALLVILFDRFIIIIIILSVKSIEEVFYPHVIFIFAAQ